MRRRRGIRSRLRAALRGAAVVVLSLGAAPALGAQALGSGTVAAATATIHARCDPSSPVRATLRRGDTVILESVNERWVNVRVGPDGEQGCMRRSELQPSTVLDRAAEAQRTRAQARARAAATGTPRTRSGQAILSVNASYLTASQTVGDTRTFDLFAEQGRFTTAYDIPARIGIDAGGFARVWRGVAAGVAFTSHTDDGPLAVDGSVPHPLLFGRNRAVEGTVPGSRKETAVHVQAAYVVPAGRSLQVIVFGGPSVVRVEQTVVTGIRYTDSFPFDEAEFSGADVSQERETRPTFNVGADVAYYLTDHLGVGGIVRFAPATVTLSVGEVDAGGVTIGGGIRVRF